MSISRSISSTVSSRSPHRERGLKFFCLYKLCKMEESLPSQGAWIEMLAIGAIARCFLSLPSQGAWIEIMTDSTSQIMRRCRSPHRERGLKWRTYKKICKAHRSLPSQGAWIEMISTTKDVRCLRRSPHRERGLKSIPIYQKFPFLGRSPHRERGLKFCCEWDVCIKPESRSPHRERGLK